MVPERTTPPPADGYWPLGYSTKGKDQMTTAPRCTRSLKEIGRHLFYLPWHTRTLFPAEERSRIEQAISAAERHHSGEIALAVEAALPLPALIRGTSARDRALELFSSMRVWDTQHNNGVLLYLLLAERDVEIIADRGINPRVGADEWQRLCHLIERHFQQRRPADGIIAAIGTIGELLRTHFPTTATDEPNEVPNEPFIR